MRIALLGAGHIGGSLALALKEGGGDVHITAFDTAPSHGETLLTRGAIDHVAATAVEAVRDADLVVFATPLRSYRALAESIAPALAPGVVITDIGSVKTSMRAVRALLPGARIVPGHPIAGSEKSGPDAASGELFQNRLCILTPDASTDAGALQIVETLWHLTGADVLHMPVEVHDQIYAYVSHLPHFIAFVAASYFHGIGVKLLPGDAVLQQFLRISRSNARMWSDVALENREALLPALATYIALLEHFATELRAGEKPAVPPEPLAIAKALLPRILAASLISSVSLYEKQSDMNLRPFGAGGMRDVVAPAAHAPEEDMEAISNAAPATADHIDAILPRFRALEKLIGAEDADALFTTVSTMVADAHALATPRN
jgi:prephenate dehydrogenase